MLVEHRWLVCPICMGLMIPRKDGEPKCDRCKQKISAPTKEATETNH